MNSRLRVLLASILGVSLTIGLLFALTIPDVLLWSPKMSSYTFTSSETGITVEKLILLDYFNFMPWPVSNLMRVEFFQAVDYDDPIEESGFLFALFHSLFFLLGAFIAVTLSGVQRKNATEYHRKGRLPAWMVSTLQGNPPPWVLYTLMTLVAHLVLILIAATHYVGPGGSVWLYPSPLWLIPFAIGIGVISYITQVIYTSLPQVIGSK